MSMPSLCAVLLAFSGLALVAAEPDPTGGYRILSRTRLGGNGGWDLLTIDADARRLYIARSDRVMVVDADTGALIGEMAGHGVHGIAIDQPRNRGYFTNGADDTVTIFDLTTRAIVGAAKTGTKPDAIIVDSATQLVVVCDNGGTDLTLLSCADGSVAGRIEVGGAPELVAVDGQGRLYTNLEDKDEVAAVDLRARTLAAHWPLAPGKGPSGVAVDVAHHRLFSACHDSRTLEVLNAADGHIVASLPIGERCDGAVFDDASQTVFVPNGGGTLSIIHEDDPDHFTTSTLGTSVGARTIALDGRSHQLYLVTAEPKPAEPGVAPGGRPQWMPDTFEVLVVGR